MTPSSPTTPILPRLLLLGLLAMFAASLLAASPVRPWTAPDKDLWKKSVKRVVTTPPCCGACGVLSMDDGRTVYRYILGEDTSGSAAALYRANERKLMDAFRFFSPERYEHWFGKTGPKEEKK